MASLLSLLVRHLTSESRQNKIITKLAYGEKPILRTNNVPSYKEKWQQNNRPTQNSALDHRSTIVCS